jgi:pimeloyl-ACP methyl ester carboxylesterase/tetrahydromethanopterin S-methyltransferase subunit F
MNGVQRSGSFSGVSELYKELPGAQFKPAGRLSERAQTTVDRGGHIRAQLKTSPPDGGRMGQLKPSAQAPAQLVPRSSALKSGLSLLGKALLAGGLIAAGVLTGGIALTVLGSVIGGAVLLNRAVNAPLMRTCVFGQEAARKDEDARTFANTKIREMGNANEVTVTTSSGQAMRGNFFSPASSGGPAGEPDVSRPVVLLLTGSGGCAQDQGHELAKMYSHGQPEANVMSVNYRGYGDSDGGLPSKDSVYKDGHAMFNELLKMGFKPEQIVVHGYSMGATVAAKIQESAQRQGLNLKAVVYDRPMTSVFNAAKAHSGGGVTGSLAGQIGRWGAGPMDCQAKVKALKPEAAPPMLVTYDAEALGPGAKKMGQGLIDRLGADKVTLKATGHDHLDNAGTTEQLGNEYKRLLS